jgi:hypothetical protein
MSTPGATPVLGSGNSDFDQDRFNRHLKASRVTRFLFTLDGEKASKQEWRVEAENV